MAKILPIRRKTLSNQSKNNLIYIRQRIFWNWLSGSEKEDENVKFTLQNVRQRRKPTVDFAYYIYHLLLVEDEIKRWFLTLNFSGRENFNQYRLLEH